MSANDETPHICPDSSEYEVRVKKVRRLRAQQIEPWPEHRRPTHAIKQVREDFDRLVGDGVVVYCVGRIMSIRAHGKSIFAHLQDSDARIQLYIKKETERQAVYDFFDAYVDIGDYVWVVGIPFRTKTGEPSIKVDDLTLLSKCLHPLPEKFHGLADIETRYRQRYLDLITNPQARERFRSRSRIVQVMRKFLDDRGFIEVETPMLHPIPGGAAAQPFITHHNALRADFYLRIAPELYLKRLVIGGFERVYEINRNFRNEGISVRHNPEFTMLEFYMAHRDYHCAMDMVEEMLRAVVHRVCNQMKVPYAEQCIDFERPFRRLSMHEALMHEGGFSHDELSPSLIDETLRRCGITMKNSSALHGEKINELFSTVVEPKLLEPTFISHFPIEVSPLAKKDPENPSLAARFELFIAGMEIGNGFNELNDPFDQAERFREQACARSGGDAEAHFYDAEYVEALEHALPPTVGVGIGVDRLTMLLTNTPTIKEVILFPTLKRKDI